MRGIAVSWSIGPEQLRPLRTAAAELNDDGILKVDGGTVAGAGFLRFIATVTDEGSSYCGNW
jgi:hypothetical protein